MFYYKEIHIDDYIIESAPYDTSVVKSMIGALQTIWLCDSSFKVLWL